MTNRESLPVFHAAARPQHVPPELLAMPPEAQIRLVERVGVVECNAVATVADYVEVTRATIARQAQGYFNLTEAAQILADETGSPFRTQLKKLKRAIETGAIEALDRDDKMPVLELADVDNYAPVLRGSDMVKAGFQFPVVVSHSTQHQNAPAENGKKWTPEFTEGVRAYRGGHTEKETAEKYGVSGTLIRRKLAPPKKAQAHPFGGLGSREK